MSTATLGFAIDSSQAAGAAADLDRLTSSAAKAEQAATKVSGAGTRMSRGFADLNPALDKIIGSLGRLEGIASSIDKRLDMMSSAATRAARANTVLDKSAVEASSAYKQLEASLNAVTAAQRKADSAQAGSLAMIEKQKAAIASLNAEMAKLRNQPMPSQTPRSNTPKPANSNFQTGNIAAQLFDIGSTAAFMSPGTVGLQQGPQLAQAFAGQSAKQALTGLAAGFAAIVSPVSLAAIGLTTAAAAAIQFGSAALSGIGSATSALEKHDAILKGIKERYDAAAESGTQYGQRTQAAIAFSANQDQTALQKSLETGLKTFAYRATPQIDWSQYQYPGTDMAGVSQQAMRDQFGSFADIVNRFIDQARAGKGDILEFNKEVQDLANTDPSNKAMQRIATTLLGYSEAATKAAEAQKELNEQQREFSMMMSRTEAAANAQKYQAANSDQAFYRDRRFNADLAGIGARSPAQLAAAERARLESEAIDPGKESPENRATRINQQVELTRRRAQQQLDEAQKDRARNLDKTLQDQQSEIDLIGKTGGAAAALRKEYELTSQLRLDAARQGIDVDQAELDLIHQRAKALGELTDQYNQARFSFEMRQQSADARLSPRDLQITRTLRQYGLPEDLGSSNASMIGKQYDWQQAKDLAKGFGDAFSNELVSGSHNIGKAFLKGFEASLSAEASKLWEKVFDSLGNVFADWLTGSKGGAGSAASSGVGAVASAVLGGAANDNMGKAPVIPVTRSALGDISSYAKAIQSIESGGNYGALGPLTKSGDRAYGAYQVMGANIPSWTKGALGTSMSPSEFLGSKQAQDAVFSKYFGDSVSKFGNPQDAASVWFTGRPLAQGAGAADVLGTTGSQYVDKFNAALGDASKSVGTFGNGLGTLGQSLSSIPAAGAASGGGGGGLFGWLGSLFGGGKGVSPLSSSWAPNTTYGQFIGAFADGTNYAPGGLAIVGERGPELVNLPQGSQVFNTNKSRDMMGANSNNPRAQQPKFDIHIYGGSGDQHIRDLVQQGVMTAQAEQNNQMRRGGFGDMQRRYSNQKA